MISKQEETERKYEKGHIEKDGSEGRNKIIEQRKIKTYK
jgi:hypothetical protein